MTLVPVQGLRLVCEVCGREFVVDVSVYRSLRGVVPCPGCGSTDLVLLDAGGDTGPAPEPPRGSTP